MPSAQAPPPHGQPLNDIDLPSDQQTELDLIVLEQALATGAHLNNTVAPVQTNTVTNDDTFICKLKSIDTLK